MEEHKTAILRRLYNFLADVVHIATSRERQKQLWRVSLFSNALYLTISSALTNLLGFVFWIIAARYYSVEDVGLASAAIVAVGLVTTFAHLGLGMGLVRFLSSSGRKSAALINTTFTIGALAAAVAGVIFVLGIDFWSPALTFIKEEPGYLTTFLILCVVYQLWYLAENAFVASRRSAFVTGQNLIFNLLRLPLVILLSLWFSSFGTFSAWGIAMAIALVVSLFFFLPKVQTGYRLAISIDKVIMKAIMRFSSANYASTLFWLAPGMVLPLMVVNISGAEANAYFYIAWTIGAMLPITTGAVSTSLFAEASHDEESLKLNTQRSLKMAFLILVPVVVLVLVAAPLLLQLFGGPYAENGATLLRIMAVSSLPAIINGIYLSVKRVEKDLKALVAFAAFAAASSIGLASWLLPEMGIDGVGVAWLVSQLALALIAITTSSHWWKALRRVDAA